MEAPPAAGDEVGRVGLSLARASELLRRREAALREARDAADALTKLEVSHPRSNSVGGRSATARG